MAKAHISLNYFLEDLIGITQDTLDALLELDEYTEGRGDKQGSGYLVVVDVTTSNLVICLHFGTEKVAKEADLVGPDFLRFLDLRLKRALGNAIRLWASHRKSKTCITAFQCANLENQEGGGAVVSNGFILSCSGLGDEADEALATGIARRMILNRMSQAQALRIAKISRNSLIKPLLNEILS